METPFTVSRTIKKIKRENPFTYIIGLG